MYHVGFLIICLFFSTIGYGKDCKSAEVALPRFSKFLVKKKKDFLKEYGPYTEKSIAKIPCDKISDVTDRRLFEWKKMIPFIIDENCRAVYGDNEKKHAPQQVMASEKKIIGGGAVSCLISKGEKSYYVSNYSKRYCFDFTVLTKALGELSQQGIELKKIYVKYKLKKFCKKEVTSVEKIRNVVANKDFSFGYKKSHIYRGDQFIHLISSLNAQKND